MKKFLIILCAIAFAFYQDKPAKFYTTKRGEISFYSKAPIEDIDAHNKNVGVVLKTEDNELAFVVLINMFEFKKKKMQKDFQQNFLESDKYSKATFTGRINEEIDYTKDGVYNVTTTGKLKIHGVERPRTERGTITVKGDTVTLRSDFKIRVADFKVKIPKLLTQNIAEVVDVTVKADLIPGQQMLLKSGEKGYSKNL